MNEPGIVINQQLLSSITTQQAWHYRILPNTASNGSLSFFADVNNVFPGFEDELEILTGKTISIEKISSEVAETLLDKFYPRYQQDSRQQTAYYTAEPDSFLNHLISEARSLHSSDIHIEPFEELCRVRIRIDGMLIQRYLIDKKQYPTLVNKIKITANLDIAEKRLPQDGRIFFEQEHHKFDIRVSVLPTLYGEKIVLRLLNNDAANIDISTLGFSETDLRNYMDGIRKPNGIILISGPTGSGKTTTLYATLKLLNKNTRNILTIEDPIEYTLEGINQVQLKENIGLTFSAALRTFLRQDPDIIMLGEIRDVETANMAIRAALTGHLVFSTIHTNSAWGIVSRLIDMGIAPYLIASTLNTAIAQRLVRLLCQHCRKLEAFDHRLYPSKFKAPREIKTHYTSKGCSECFNTGYKGRKAVYEVIPIENDVADRIKEEDFDISEFLLQNNISLLSRNAFILFEKGETSLEEVYSLLTI